MRDILFRQFEPKENVQILMDYQGYEIPESSDNIDICISWFFDVLKWREYNLEYGVPEKLSFEKILSLKSVYEVVLESEIYFFEVISAIDEEYIQTMYERKRG